MWSVQGQYRFTGQVNKEVWSGDVYLSIVEDYRRLSGIYPEQIISKVKVDSTGQFVFTGDQLEEENKIYRIHVDNCFENQEDLQHFDGHCNNSKTVIFIANNNATMDFPFSFENEMFCEIKSNNQKANSFIKIDSLKVEMAYDFASYRSEANRKLNNRKWFANFQTFGKSLNEPLAELYIFSFLTDKSSNFHTFYVEDLQRNDYYKNLLKRLENSYPNSTYTEQYRTELEADKYASQIKVQTPWNSTRIIWIALLTVSVALNIWFFLKMKRNKKINILKQDLTKQEQNVLNLLLAGRSNKEIAQELFISLSTVKTHLNNIFKKLNIQSREEAKSLFNK
ncbi:response regulator transcription factor [Cognatitamlana onchidii]|uniref:response regulator transcription factor n=1 Tax=Cognatitamlana onchidii TaxID=2562860 RepID=UPI0010A6A1B2|nr:helix-turn-helix transcriptional regulator [Algibacter onchidii]